MRARKIDDNQKEIVAMLRMCGFSVAITSGLGKGFPDIICGARGQNFLFEIKDGEKCKSKQKLTPDEKEFHDKWRGQITVISNIDEALEYLRKRV